jgi:hypothetical protein
MPCMQLGSLIRRKYHENERFLSEHYSYDQVACRAVDTDRTIISSEVRGERVSKQASTNIGRSTFEV